MAEQKDGNNGEGNILMWKNLGTNKENTNNFLQFLPSSFQNHGGRGGRRDTHTHTHERTWQHRGGPTKL